MIGKKNNKKLTFDEIRNILHQLNNTFKIYNKIMRLWSIKKIGND